MSQADTRRSGDRVKLAEPICFVWRMVGGDIRRARGVIRDISAGGVYALLDHPMAAGLWVYFDAAFPAELTGGEPQKVRCKGQILRSDRLAGHYGIVVSIKSRQIMENPKLHRRSYVRVVPPHLVTAEHPLFRMIVRDIHRAGAFLETTRRSFPLGEEIELLLQGLPREIQVQAVVRRVEPGIGVGVEFAGVSVEADRSLQDFLQNLSHAA